MSWTLFSKVCITKMRVKKQRKGEMLLIRTPTLFLPYINTSRDTSQKTTLTPLCRIDTLQRKQKPVFTFTLPEMSAAAGFDTQSELCMLTGWHICLMPNTRTYTLRSSDFGRRCGKYVYISILICLAIVY